MPTITSFGDMYLAELQELLSVEVSLPMRCCAWPERPRIRP